MHRRHSILGRSVLLSAVLLVAGCSGSAPPQKPRLRVIAIGDSLTAQGYYPWAVAERLDASGRWQRIALEIHGIGGATPADLLEQVRGGTIPVAAPAIALVMAGTNAYDEATVLELAREVAGRGATVVVVATPPRREDPVRGPGMPVANRDFNDRLAELIPEARPRLPARIQRIDVRWSVRDPQRAPADGDWLDPRYALDHVHLNEEGHERFGAAVGDALLARLPP
jgi:lysophospholipase L1-like esterase